MCGADTSSLRVTLNCVTKYGPGVFKRRLRERRDMSPVLCIFGPGCVGDVVFGVGCLWRKITVTVEQVDARRTLAQTRKARAIRPAELVVLTFGQMLMLIVDHF